MTEAGPGRNPPATRPATVAFRLDFHGVLVLELSSGEYDPVETILARSVRARTFLNNL